MPIHDFIYVPGQRWVSDTETDLGLGMVADVDERTVSLLFVASGEQRVYARHNAPLSRVRFNVGEVTQAREEWEMRVEKVHEEEGILIYEGTRLDNDAAVLLPESELNSFLQITDAQSRLLNGQVDINRWFELRIKTHQVLDEIQKTSTYGLGGVRVNLIPHQLFIADEVAKRFAPRALLADEVGLGKTIEACLIVHKQLLVGRAQRILIVVPDPLLHQWLVELRRRFNLRFSLFDEERCEAIEGSDERINPFDTEQLVLTTYSLLQTESRAQQIADVDWDILVVDEAHHLIWDEEKPNDLYLAIQSLAERIPGVLLLTATPEQLGEKSHFARLRLLDPDRFTDFQTFIDEQNAYRRISEIVDDLVSGEELSSETISKLREVSGDLNVPDLTERNEIIRDLIDRHGPSRVLFRNTRTNIPGFPKRVVHQYPLEGPDTYLLPQDAPLEHLLFPERSSPKRWIKFDNRIQLIQQLLQEHPTQKILLICAHAQTAMELEQALRVRHGMHVAMFHEQMTMVARDRAAHFFADPDGSRLLICSEIGSEGRNFQFAHHLLLFDMPLNPDLLEQRIGRLDRIGQTRDIQIHVPYFLDSSQEILFRWYHEGLNAFQSTCPVGQSVFEDMRAELTIALKSPSNQSDLDALVNATKSLYHEKMQILEEGRDKLLEISSFDQVGAQQLVDAILYSKVDISVKDYLAQVFDSYGVDFEDKDAHSYFVRPSEHMHAAFFPGLGQGDLTVTFERDVALAHEDIDFLTWEHPMSRGAMDLITTSQYGKTAVIGVEFNLLPRGSVLVETCFNLELIASNAPDLRRFLSCTSMQFLLDEKNRDLSKLLGSDRLFNRVRDIEKLLVHQLVDHKRDVIVDIINRSTDKAMTAFSEIIESGRINLEKSMEAELQRLVYLKSLHASVRDEEIQLLQEQKQVNLELFSRTKPRLDAVRLIVIL